MVVGGAFGVSAVTAYLPLCFVSENAATDCFPPLADASSGSTRPAT